MAGREPMISTSRPGRVAVALCVALLLLWPALVNGGPFFHPDTPSYFRAAASGFYKLADIKTEWVEAYLRIYGSPADAPTIASAAHARPQIPVTLSGRSTYYGVFVYAAYLAGSTWIAVLLQCILAAASIIMTVLLINRAFQRESSIVELAVIGFATALLTSAGYFSGQLMPGIFTGIGLLALVNMVFLWSRMTGAERLFWSATLAYSTLVHSTNLLLFACGAIVGCVLALLYRLRLNRAQLCAVAACIAVGWLGQIAFSQAVKHLTGAPPVRPPFVAMRLIADGPGILYLRDHCPAERIIYCRVLTHPQSKSDELLWSKDPQVSLFRGLSPAEQRQSAAQQTKFVFAVLRERPLQIIATAAENSVGQLFDLDLDSFNYTDNNRDGYKESVPPTTLRSLERTKSFERQMPTAFIVFTTTLLCMVSLLQFVAFIFKSSERHLRAYVLTVIAIIGLNAIICGALSGPKGRYEMRLVWVLPAIAGALAAAQFAGRRGLQADDDDLSVPHRSGGEAPFGTAGAEDSPGGRLVAGGNG